MLFRRILLSALLSGFIAGGLLGVLQLYITAPIILAAEAYENPQHNNGEETATHTHGVQDSVKSNLVRNLYSIAATIIIAWAYALILQSAMTLYGRVTRRSGILWGLAGYLIFFAVPAIGLPPEIPATQSSAVEFG